MLSLILFTVFLNLAAVCGVFVWAWLVAGKGKEALTEKLQSVEKNLAALDGEVSVSINANNDFSETVLTNFKHLSNAMILHGEELLRLKEELKQAKEASSKVSDQHEEYHDGMLEKLNHAGELIVNYESFYESTLSELDEISRFLDILSKRPTLSSDPDFSNFTRAIQLMSQIVSKYSSVAVELKKETKVIKPD